DGNIRSLLAQDYEGELEFLFVSPRKDDPAYLALERLLAQERGRVRASLLCSDATPVRCSEKILNMLYALKRVPESSELLVFVDADVRAHPRWLRHLVAPLEDAGTVASAAHAIYLPYAFSLWQLARLACTGYSVCGMALGRVLVGWSWAIRRRDFEGLGIAGVWERVLDDDVALDRVFARDGRRLAWACRAGAAFWDECTPTVFQRNFNKAFLWLRYYDPLVWAASMLAVSSTAALVLWSLLPPFHPRLLAALFAVHALNLGAIFAILRAYLPRQFEGIHPALRAFPLWTALCAPFIMASYAAAAVNSLFSREVRWGGYVYRLDGPFDIRVVGKY
ncbi:MAG: glycosyltransferase family 2 protein, partial [Elusimicrobiota bacterium]